MRASLTSFCLVISLCFGCGSAGGTATETPTGAEPHDRAAVVMRTQLK